MYIKVLYYYYFRGYILLRSNVNIFILLWREKAQTERSLPRSQVNIVSFNFTMKVFFRNHQKVSGVRQLKAKRKT